MRWIGRIGMLSIALMVSAVLCYSLPSRDIVRIVGTDIKRMDIDGGWFWAATDSGTTQTGTRDVRFIEAIWPSGGERVYRNEDTNWGWPPYMKFDSGDLSARAKSLVSSEANPQWVIVTHYGWRVQLFSMFPNVIDIEPADSPDQRLIPWFNIVVVALLLGALTWAYIAIRSFVELTLEPAIAGMKTGLADRTSGIRRWFGG